METELELRKLLNLYFKNGINEFKKNLVRNVKQLVTKKLLIPSDNREFVKLNFNSKIFYNSLLKLAEEKLGTSFPLNPSGSLLFIDNFEKELRKEYKPRALNEYNTLIDSFRDQALLQLKLENSIDLTKFLYSLPGKDKRREHHLYSYEKHYFNVLPFLNFEIEEICQIIVAVFNNEVNKKYALDFCRNLSLINLKIAVELYNYGTNNGLLECKNLVGSILIGLSKIKNKSAFKKAIELMDIEQYEGCFVLARFQYDNLKQVQRVYNLIEKVNPSNEEAYFLLIDVYLNIISSEYSSDSLKNLCFKKIIELFDTNDPRLQRIIIYNCTHFLKGHEEERYNLLLHFINKTGDFSLLSHYFFDFVNPKYLFNLLTQFFSSKILKDELKHFEHAIHHFWNVSPQKTEYEILCLIISNNKILRINTIKLILAINSNSVDLLSINKEVDQITAINALLKFPYAIEKLIPLVLKFRNSRFKKTVQLLKEQLSYLVFAAYHNYLYNLIEANLSSTKKDQLFLATIKNAMESYSKMREFKTSVKDLDPRENEKGLMELYYRLEHENKTQMIQDVQNKSGFLRSFWGKSVTIVRGNSLKVEGHIEVTPLNNFSTSIAIDCRAFKNPDLFEIKITN